MIPFLRGLFASVIALGSESGPTYSAGTGSPEGVVTAPVGSRYSRTDGGTNTATYRKESGAGNTGWVADSAVSGSLTSVLTTVDFGSTPVMSKVFIISHTGASTGQNVIATPSTNMPSGVQADELELEPIVINACIPSADNVELYIVAAEGGFLTGQRNINYMVI